MAIHYVSVGIEANSKEEAEKKILEMQDIVTAYTSGKIPKKDQQGDIPFWVTALTAIGIVLLAGSADNKAAPAKESPSPDSLRREAERKRRERQRKEPKDETPGEELNFFS